MYRNKEVVHSGEAGDGVCFVINGIVKVACIDLKDTQDYFLGSGEPCCWFVCPSVCLSVCLSVSLSVCQGGLHGPERHPGLLPGLR